MKSALMFFIFIYLACAPMQATAERPEPALSPLPLTAHAHNDYQHDHPLWEALHWGFNSIEVDVCLMEGAFFVAHDAEDIRASQTLRSLYLDPLRELINKNQGHVYQNGSGIVLMIDIKTDAAPGWEALQPLLAQYGDLNNGSVGILVSGNRDLEAMVSARGDWVRYDGRLSDLQNNPDLPIISLISANWTEEFSWNGQGKIPPRDELKLRNIVSAAQEQGRKLRFWGTDFPDIKNQEKLWSRLLDEGVDIICTDQLQAFSTYIQTRRPQ